MVYNATKGYKSQVQKNAFWEIKCSSTLSHKS